MLMPHTTPLTPDALSDPPYDERAAQGCVTVLSCPAPQPDYLVPPPAPTPSPALKRILQNEPQGDPADDAEAAESGLKLHRQLVFTSTTTQVQLSDSFTLVTPKPGTPTEPPETPPLKVIPSGRALNPLEECALLNEWDLERSSAARPRLITWLQAHLRWPWQRQAQAAAPAPSAASAEPEPKPEPKPEPEPADPVTSGAAVLKHQAQAAALEDLHLTKSLGLKRSEVMLNSLRQHLSWVLLSFGSLALAFICLAALIAQSQRPALQPYVVTVDRHGVVLNRGLLPPTTEALTPALVAAQLSDFVRHVRMVTPDKTLQRQLMTRAYALVAPGSKVFLDLDAYFNAHNPLSPRAPYAVSVDILNVIATGEHTVQIDWREVSQSAFSPTEQRRAEAAAGATGNTTAKAQAPGAAHTRAEAQSVRPQSYERTMRALISFKQGNALTSGQVEGAERLLLLNPLGLIVTEFVVSDVIV